MRWAALCLGVLGRWSSLAHATSAARLGVSNPASRHWDCGSRRHLCYTSKLHGSDMHGYHPCLVSRNSLGTTGRPPICYSGCLVIGVNIWYVWLSFQGAKYTHIWGYEWLVAMGLGGWVACRIGLGCVAAPLEVVSADIHSPAPIPKEGGPLSSVTLSGWLE